MQSKPLGQSDLNLQVPPGAPELPELELLELELLELELLELLVQGAFASGRLSPPIPSEPGGSGTPVPPLVPAPPLLVPVFPDDPWSEHPAPELELEPVLLESSLQAETPYARANATAKVERMFFIRDMVSSIFPGSNRLKERRRAGRGVTEKTTRIRPRASRRPRTASSLAEGGRIGE